VVILPTLDLDVNVNVKVKSIMRIGELSKATGLSTRALRYYEEQDLLHSERRPNGYREYGPDSVHIVAFIHDLHLAGLSSEVIRHIMPCARQEHPQGDCSALVDRVRQVRDELASQERRIAKRRRTLDGYLAGADAPRGLGTIRANNASQDRPKAAAPAAKAHRAGE
jgi:DNA-binding transcriptional MerR regulator